ncbi:MAG TPA: sulfocyanin-like copper-binding protein [Chloroflexota bacterium]
MFSSAVKHDVVLKITAGKTSANSGFNFDGFAKGAATFTVPLGWGVTIELTNSSKIPYSLAITTNLKEHPTLPHFGIAPTETPNPIQGISAGKFQLFSFPAVQAGNYFIACLVPGHLQSGMWDRFTISRTANAPSKTAK